MTDHEKECPIIKMTKVISYVVATGAIAMLGMILYHGVILGGFTNSMNF